MKIKEKTKTKSKPVKATQNFLSWFEIPTTNMERAILFYSTIFNIKFETFQTNTHTMAFFPINSGLGGALVYGDGCLPSQSGSLLYLNTGAELEETLKKINLVGGLVLMEKTQISEEFGYYSLILDSEGNRIALYSRV